MKKEKLTFGCLGIIALFVISAIWGGYCLSIVWNWYMPSIFSLPELSIPQAIIVATLVEYLTKAYVSSEDKKDLFEAFITSAMVVVFRPLFLLAIGWLLRGFVI